MLNIKDLHVAIEGKKILKGLNLSIEEGQVHAVMGPNGAGKSTLGKVLAGHPSYKVLEGEISFMGRDLLALEPEERAHLGLFLSFQYPPEIPGVSAEQFLAAALNAKRKANGEPILSDEAFSQLLDETLKELQIASEFKVRDQNVGFSGGEKKRSEILQMALLEPRLSILDETDSGLDMDALRVVAEGLKRLRKQGQSMLIITHYLKMLELLSPSHVHILIDGRIVESGGPALAELLEEKGFSPFGG